MFFKDFLLSLNRCTWIPYWILLHFSKTLQVKHGISFYLCVYTFIHAIKGKSTRISTEYVSPLTGTFMQSYQSSPRLRVKLLPWLGPLLLDVGAKADSVGTWFCSFLGCSVVMMTAAAGIRRPLLKSSSELVCCHQPTNLMSRLSHTLIRDKDATAGVSRLCQPWNVICQPSQKCDHSAHSLKFHIFLLF